MELSMDMENFTGTTEQATLVNLSLMTFRVTVSTPGAMEDASTASGRRIKCTEWAYSNGPMVAFIKDRLLTIVKRAREF